MKREKREDPLDTLITSAGSEILGKLIKELALARPEIRRECFEFLKDYVDMAPDEEAVSKAEIIFALWMELEPDLSELDEYGGGDYSTMGHVDELLYELSEKLKESTFPRESRRELLDEVLPYIRSGNAGMDDALYEVTYDACYDEDDLRDLAQRFEAVGQDWPLSHARDIYRKIGDQEKYLELRSLRMEYGSDYHDLATFYWEAGNKEKAVEIARQGLKKGHGRMDEIRSFLAERAMQSGDREQYIELQFAQATDGLSAKKYESFKKICTEEEWLTYEPQMIKNLEKVWDEEKLKIYMIRAEYGKAVTILSKMRYPHGHYSESDIMRIAAKLEERYPEQILSFYMSGLGNLNHSSNRKVYAQKAAVMAKVRHMLVVVMKSPDKWEIFARKTRNANLKRPAFQEEFAKVVPGWKTL